VETVGPVAVAFTADLIPIAMVNKNPNWRWRTVTSNGETYTFKDITDSGYVYGAGLSPVGLHVSAAVWRSLRAYAAGSVGGIWFTRETPVPYAQRFNYALEFGGGLEASTGTTYLVEAGFKLHHLSNMNAARSNPGLDGHVFYVGLLRRRSRLR
jgi:Lipid A 3-O-deacylase (PagL)